MAHEYSSDRRRHPRFKVSLQAVLSSFDEKPFSSPTRDISAGGLSLEQEIPPKLLGSDCLVRILGPEGVDGVELKCRVFNDPVNPRRMMFIDPPEDSLRRLLQWVLKAGGPR